MQIGKRWWRQLVLILGSMLFAASSEAAGPLGPAGPAPIPAAPAPQAPKVTPPQIVVPGATINPGGSIFQHSGGSSTGDTRTDNADAISGADNNDTLSPVSSKNRDTISGAGSNLLTPFGSKNRDTVSTFNPAEGDRNTVFGGTGNGQKAGSTDTVSITTGTRSDIAQPDTVRGGGVETRTRGGATVQGGSGTERNAYSGTTTVNPGTVPVTGSGFNGTFQAPSNTPTR